MRILILAFILSIRAHACDYEFYTCLAWAEYACLSRLPDVTEAQCDEYTQACRSMHPHVRSIQSALCKTNEVEQAMYRSMYPKADQ